jgi:phage gp46-like protein
MGDYGQNAIQVGDILLFHSSEDCGDIIEEGGIVQMTQGFDTMVYLVLMGGNEEDDGSESTEKLQWWGNEGEPEERKYRGKFNAKIRGGKPITSAFIREVEEAGIEDLETAFVQSGLAKSVEFSCSAPSAKRLNVSGKILLLSGDERSFNFGVPL